MSASAPVPAVMVGFVPLTVNGAALGHCTTWRAEGSRGAQHGLGRQAGAANLAGGPSIPPANACARMLSRKRTHVYSQGSAQHELLPADMDIVVLAPGTTVVLVGTSGTAVGGTSV